MFSKIGLLPAVQGLVKSGLEGKFLRKRAGVKQMELEDGATPVNAVMANIPIKGSRNFRRSSQQH